MTIHINSRKEDISKIVLMPGDPLRAKYIASKFLTKVKMVNEVRNMFMYTGYYKDKKITVAASGMGCASIGIYSYELFKFYDVDLIIRIGTCGSYSSDIKIKDIINLKNSYSESKYAKLAANINEDKIDASKTVWDLIKNTGNDLGLDVKSDITAHCTDSFYTHDKELFKKHLKNHNTKIVEMESFALFANAILLNKKAACLLTVTDSLLDNKEYLSSEERQTKLNDMIKLSLEAALKFK